MKAKKARTPVAQTTHTKGKAKNGAPNSAKKRTYSETVRTLNFYTRLG